MPLGGREPRHSNTNEACPVSLAGGLPAAPALWLHRDPAQTSTCADLDPSRTPKPQPEPNPQTLSGMLEFPDRWDVLLRGAQVFREEAIRVVRVYHL